MQVVRKGNHVPGKGNQGVIEGNPMSVRVISHWVMQRSTVFPMPNASGSGLEFPPYNIMRVEKGYAEGRIRAFLEFHCGAFRILLRCSSLELSIAVSTDMVFLCTPFAAKKALQLRVDFLREA